MSFDKAIEFGKERRKPYRKSKSLDPSCRNHGDCAYCSEGRKKKKRQADISYQEQLEYYYGE